MSEQIRQSLINRLASLMSDISEDHYCAGWLIGLEYTLWRAVMRHPESYVFGFRPIETEQVAELKALAEELKGWVVWDDDIGEKFIPIDEWLPMFELTQPPQSR